MDKISNHKKWALVIDHLEVNIPTREHGIKIGNYLRSFNVPVDLVEITITVESGDTGRLRIIDSKRAIISEQLQKKNDHER